MCLENIQTQTCYEENRAIQSMSVLISLICLQQYDIYSGIYILVNLAYTSLCKVNTIM